MEIEIINNNQHIDFVKPCISICSEINYNINAHFISILGLFFFLLVFCFIFVWVPTSNMHIKWFRFRFNQLLLLILLLINVATKKRNRVILVSCLPLPMFIRKRCFDSPITTRIRGDSEKLEIVQKWTDILDDLHLTMVTWYQFECYCIIIYYHQFQANRWQ